MPDVPEVGTLRPVKGLVRDVFVELDTRGSAAAADPLPTGIAPLDELIGGGLRPRDLIVVAGPPGTGKTTVCLTIARNVAVAGRRVAYLAPGTDARETVKRLLCLESGVAGESVADPTRLTQEDWTKLFYAAERMSNTSLAFCDVPALACDQVLVVAASGAHGGSDFVVVDSIDRLRPVAARRTTVAERVDSFAGLKTVARRLHTPVLVVAEVRRGEVLATGGSALGKALDQPWSGAPFADLLLLLRRRPRRRSGGGGPRVELAVISRDTAVLGSITFDLRGGAGSLEVVEVRCGSAAAPVRPAARSPLRVRPRIRKDRAAIRR